jgi:short-subunit dehydrogenase
MDVKGKVAVITGASAGIGLATARRFAAEGARVALVARSSAKIEAVARELREKGVDALPVTADMRDREAVNRMVEKVIDHFGRLDVLINNAGQAAAGTVAELSIEDFQEIIELNVYGPVYAIQAAVPKMRAGGGGLIINVSSMVSKMQIPALGAYAATKAALNLISNTARVELASDNIRVITVYPRMTATDFGKNSLGNRRVREGQRSAAPNVVIDSAEHVAGKILEAAQKETTDQYMDQ